MLAYVHQFLFNWGFTISVETVVFIALVRRYYNIPARTFSLIWLVLGGVFASTITIPWVWFVFPVLFYHSLIISTIIGELFAFIVEAVFYVFAFRFSVRQALFISLIANAASFLLGTIVFLHG